MKKIIKNKVYNTDTAEELGTDGHNLEDRLSYRSETLYRKKTGEYFLWGQGGPNSKYAVRSGLNWTGSSVIIPLTYDQAREWAEEHLDTEEYEAAFGEICEDDSTVRLHLHIPAACAETIRRRAAQQGVTISEYVVSLVKDADK